MSYIEHRKPNQPLQSDTPGQYRPGVGNFSSTSASIGLTSAFTSNPSKGKNNKYLRSLFRVKTLTRYSRMEISPYFRRYTRRPYTEIVSLYERINQEPRVHPEMNFHSEQVLNNTHNYIYLTMISVIL